MRFRSFFTAVVTLAAFSSFIGGAVEVEAQALSADPELTVVEKQNCGPAVQLPKGTTVVQLNGRLRLTLPYGYVYAGTQSDGMPLFIESFPVQPNVRGPAIDLWDLGQAEEVEFDCTCKDQGGGLCEESYRPSTGDAYCYHADCDDCKMKVTKSGDN